MTTIKVTLTCKRCGYSWVRRVPHPKSCPECKSRKWNQIKGEVANEVNVEQSVSSE